MSILVISERGNPARQTITLSPGVTTLGRSAECAVVLANDAVSREHAAIVNDGRDYYLEDRGSNNGTLLNNVPLRARERYILRSNDIITIGPFAVQFSLEDELEQSFNDVTESDVLEVKLLKKVLRALEKEQRPSLEVLNGASEGKTLVIPTEMTNVTIGRDPACEFPIEEYVISRKHAVLKRGEDGWIAHDLKSKNGTFVNNRRIRSATPLADGDRVALGTIVCMFRNPQDVPMAAITAQVAKEHPAETPRMKPLTTEATARKKSAAAASEISDNAAITDASENSSEDDFDLGDDESEGTNVAPTDEDDALSEAEIAATSAAHAYPPPTPKRSLFDRLSPAEFGLLWGALLVLIVTLILLGKLID